MIKIGEELDAEQVVYGTFEFTPNGRAPARARSGSFKISARIVDLQAPAPGSRIHRNRRAGGSGHAGGASGVARAGAARSQARAARIRIPHRSRRRSPGRRGELHSRPAGARSRTKGKIFPAGRASGCALRRTRATSSARCTISARNTARPPIGWKRSAPKTSIIAKRSFLLGLALFQSGDYTGAQKAFQTIAAAVPLSEVYNNLGAAESRRNLPQAIDDFRKAADGDPNDPDLPVSISATRCGRKATSPPPPNISAVLDRRSPTIRWPRCWRALPQETRVSPTSVPRTFALAGSGTAEDQL